MSYAEVIKLHDIKLLGGHVNDAAREEALRILLAIVLDSASAAWCLGLSTDAPVVRWPSSLYQLLARAALESSAVWRRCSLLLDRTLHDAVHPYADRCPAELVELFLEGRDSLSGDELAALLWCLIRRQSPSHDIIAERMSLELGVVAARRLHRATLPAEA
jgi:hypothetical protein